MLYLNASEIHLLTPARVARARRHLVTAAVTRSAAFAGSLRTLKARHASAAPAASPFRRAERRQLTACLGVAGQDMPLPPAHLPIVPPPALGTRSPFSDSDLATHPPPRPARVPPFPASAHPVSPPARLCEAWRGLSLEARRGPSLELEAPACPSALHCLSSSRRCRPGGLLRGGRFVRLSAATGGRFCVSVSRSHWHWQPEAQRAGRESAQAVTATFNRCHYSSSFIGYDDLAGHCRHWQWAPGPRYYGLRPLGQPANPGITVPAPEPELFLSTENDMNKLMLSESC